MNCFSFLFVLVLALISIKAAPIDLTEEDRRNIGFQCLKETNVDLRVIDLAIETQTAPKSSPEYKQFLACSYKRQGFQNDDGEILYDNINEFLTKFYTTEDLKVLDPCRDIKGVNDAENAFNALECILENLKNLERQKQLESE